MCVCVCACILLLKHLFIPKEVVKPDLTCLGPGVMSVMMSVIKLSFMSVIGQQGPSFCSKDTRDLETQCFT